MTIEPEFSELMTDTLTIERAGASNSIYGGVAYGAPETFQGRLVKQNNAVVGNSGDTVVSRAKFWVYGTPGIKAGDRATLEDGSHPDILSVEQFPDEDGPHHEVVYFSGSG